MWVQKNNEANALRKEGANSPGFQGDQFSVRMQRGCLHLTVVAFFCFQRRGIHTPTLPQIIYQFQQLIWIWCPDADNPAGCPLPGSTGHLWVEEFPSHLVRVWVSTGGRKLGQYGWFSIPSCCQWNMIFPQLGVRTVNWLISKQQREPVAAKV